MKRVIICILCFFLFFSIAAAGIVLCYTGFISVRYLAGTIITCMVSIGLIFAYVYRVYIIPYKVHMKQIERFLQSSRYDELLESECEIFRHEREVWKKFDKMLDKQNLIQLSTKHAELLALQNQINPHFLYNTLEAIRGDALCEGLNDIADTAEALSTFFRYTISDTGNLVDLEDELENIENYFKIQKYRFGERVSLQVEFPEDYQRVLQCRIPKLTLQPIVENAVYHGLEAKSGDGLVLISIDSTQNKLILSIQDDGYGIDENELHKLNERLKHPEIKQTEKKKGGIALSNVSRRIKLLFGEEYGLHIFSITGIGTDVQVTLPIITKRDLT